MTRLLAAVAILLGVSSAYAGDAAGLDLTIEVLGRNDSVDERIVNRIEIPGVEVERLPLDQRPLAAVGNTVNGVLGGVGGIVEGVVEGVAPLLPLLRYDEWVEQRKEADQDRRREAKERAR